MEKYKVIDRSKETGSTHSLINKGMIPGIVYGKGTEPTKIAFENKDLANSIVYLDRFFNSGKLDILIPGAVKMLSNIELKNNNREKFQIIKIPMPSPVFIKKKRVPASYLNFLITNKKVLLPIFNVKEDKKVIKIFKNFFKNKKIIPIDCSKLIWGFGAIHCMTQQEPKF